MNPIDFSGMQAARSRSQAANPFSSTLNPSDPTADPLANPNAQTQSAIQSALGGTTPQTPDPSFQYTTPGLQPSAPNPVSPTTPVPSTPSGINTSGYSPTPNVPGFPGNGFVQGGGYFLPGGGFTAAGFPAAVNPTVGTAYNMFYGQPESTGSDKALLQDVYNNYLGRPATPAEISAQTGNGSWGPAGPMQAPVPGYQGHTQPGDQVSGIWNEISTLINSPEAAAYKTRVASGGSPNSITPTAGLSGFPAGVVSGPGVTAADPSTIIKPPTAPGTSAPTGDLASWLNSTPVNLPGWDNTRTDNSPKEEFGRFAQSHGGTITGADVANFVATDPRWEIRPGGNPNDPLIRVKPGDPFLNGKTSTWQDVITDSGPGGANRASFNNADGTGDGFAASLPGASGAQGSAVPNVSVTNPTPLGVNATGSTPSGAQDILNQVLAQFYANPAIQKALSGK